MSTLQLYLSKEQDELIGAIIPHEIEFDEFCTILIEMGLEKLQHEQQQREQEAQQCSS